MAVHPAPPPLQSETTLATGRRRLPAPGRLPPSTRQNRQRGCPQLGVRCRRCSRAQPPGRPGHARFTPSVNGCGARRGSRALRNAPCPRTRAPLRDARRLRGARPAPPPRRPCVHGTRAYGQGSQRKGNGGGADIDLANPPALPVTRSHIHTWQGGGSPLVPRRAIDTFHRGSPGRGRPPRRRTTTVAATRSPATPQRGCRRRRTPLGMTATATLPRPRRR